MLESRIVSNVRLWPKADIRTKSRSVDLNDRFGEKSGHSTSEQNLIVPYALVTVLL